MTQDEFDIMLESVPAWIREETLQRLSGESQKTNYNLVHIAGNLKKASSNKDQADNIDQEADKTKGNVNKAAAKTHKILVKGKGAMGKIMADSTPASAVAELTHEATKLMANAATGLTNMIPGAGKAQAGLSFATGALGKAGVVATGMGVIFAKLLHEQEKTVRSLIEFGAVASDLQGFTTFRRAAASLGMSLKEFEEIGAHAKPLALAAEGDTFSGQLALAKFLTNIDSNESFRDFGMAIDDQTRMLTQEAETLYELGMISDLSNMSQKKVIKSYETANKMALFMANSLGMQRDEALSLRDAARKEIGFRTATIQNGNVIAEILGEEAATNIANAQGYMAQFTKGTLGEEFMNSTLQTMTMAIHEFDNGDFSVANNLDEALAEKLNTMGLLDDYVGMLDSFITGEVGNGEEAYKLYTSFLTKIRETDPTDAGFNDVLRESNLMIAEALQIPDSFFRQDPVVLNDPDFLADAADAADKTIDTIDDMRVTFKQMQDTLLPGFKTTGKSFNFLSKGLMGMGNILSNRLGLEDRFHDIYLQVVNENIETEMNKVNPGNIDLIIKQTFQKVDELERDIEIRQTMMDSGWVGENGEVLNEFQQDDLAGQLQVLNQQVYDQELLMTALLEKNVKLLGEDVINTVYTAY